MRPISARHCTSLSRSLFTWLGVFVVSTQHTFAVAGHLIAAKVIPPGFCSAQSSSKRGVWHNQSLNRSTHQTGPKPVQCHSRPRVYVLLSDVLCSPMNNNYFSSSRLLSCSAEGPSPRRVTSAACRVTNCTYTGSHMDDSLISGWELFHRHNLTRRQLWGIIHRQQGLRIKIKAEKFV